MTKEKKQKSDKPLEKMTVKELREVAKDIPDITGVHGMKKDELLVAIHAVQGGGEDTPAQAGDSATPKAPAKAVSKKGGAKPKRTSLTKKEIKGLIKGLKTKRRQALSDKDAKMAGMYRRQISRLKKRSRKAA